MKRGLKGLLVVGLAVALGACGTVSTPAVQAKLTGRSITVVSVVGETVKLSWRGTTVFNNEFGEAAVSDWGLRTRVEDRAVAMLEDSKRFSQVHRAQISATRREEALAQVEELKTGSEHVLLISPNESGDSIFDTSVGFVGLGVAQRSIANVFPKSAAHASLKADLIERGSFQQRILAQSVSANAQRIPGPALLGGPRLNPEHSAAVREALRVQVDAVVTSLLTQMGLDEPVGRPEEAPGPASDLPQAPVKARKPVLQSGEARPSAVAEPVLIGPGQPLQGPAR
ncbi:MAG: hypothetical protein R3E56_03710 [Burkholderiaceae bacterium]